MSDQNEELARLRLYRAMTEGRGNTPFRQRGGNLVVAAAMPAANALAPTQWELLLEWDSDIPRAVEWQNQLQITPATAVPGFPGFDYSSGWCAGAYYDASNVWAYGTTNLICKIETGSGSNARRFYTDLRVGRFSLGVQSSVKISVARWIANDPNGYAVNIQASVSPAEGTDADPPTYTAEILLPADASFKTLSSPPGAQWFDFSVGALSSQVRVSLVSPILANIAEYYKDSTLSAPIVYPPASPYPVVAAGGIFSAQSRNGNDVPIAITFWVR